MGPMKQRGAGTLVGVASVASVRGLPGHAGYCAAKGRGGSAMRNPARGIEAPRRCGGHLAPGYVAAPLTRDNDYPMPFLMQPDRFADLAVRAIDAKVRWRVIPWQMGWWPPC